MTTMVIELQNMSDDEIEVRFTRIAGNSSPLFVQKIKGKSYASRKIQHVFS